jgi:hypothetical protein
VLDNIREVILATDIAAHLRKVERIRHMVMGKKANDHHALCG